MTSRLRSESGIRSGNSEITGDGIYFLNRDSRPAPIEFFRFSTKNVERLISLAEGAGLEAVAI